MTEREYGRSTTAVAVHLRWRSRPRIGGNRSVGLVVKSRLSPVAVSVIQNSIDGN